MTGILFEKALASQMPYLYFGFVLPGCCHQRVCVCVCSKLREEIIGISIGKRIAVLFVWIHKLLSREDKDGNLMYTITPR